MLVSVGAYYEPLSDAVRQAVIEHALKSDYRVMHIDVLVSFVYEYVCSHLCVAHRDQTLPIKADNWLLLLRYRPVTKAREDMLLNCWWVRMFPLTTR